MGVGRWEAGDARTEMGDAQVGGGPHAGAVVVLGASIWDEVLGADSGVRG